MGTDKGYHSMSNLWVNWTVPLTVELWPEMKAASYKVAPAANKKVLPSQRLNLTACTSFLLSFCTFLKHIDQDMSYLLAVFQTKSKFLCLDVIFSHLVQSLTRNSWLCPESSRTGLQSRLSDPGFGSAPHTATETLLHQLTPSCCLSGVIWRRWNLIQILQSHTLILKAKWKWSSAFCARGQVGLTALSLKYLSSYLFSVNHLCFQFCKKKSLDVY